MAAIEDVFDILDLLFQFIDLFNALLAAILNFGNFLNGGLDVSPS